MILRPYQRKNANEIIAALAGGAPSVLYVLPTRGGKTVVSTEVTKTLLGIGASCCLFVHRAELLAQASRTLTAQGIAHGVIAPGESLTGHTMHVAAIDTVRARLDQPETRAWLAGLRLGQVDEAHHSEADGWGAVLSGIGGALMGMTATPYRLDGKGLGNTWRTEVRGPVIRDLIAGGYLVQPVTQAPMTASMQGISKVAGDFSRGAAARVVATPEMIDYAVRAYARFAPGEPSVWFCTTVDHANALRDAFRRAGWRAASVDGSMGPTERRDSIYGLADGTVQCLTSCEIISEGTDLPYVSLAGLCRPTASTALYMQQAGRVLTPSAGKARCTILDFVGNWTRHGLVDQPRVWSLDGGITGMERQVSALRRCGHCHRVAEATGTACPGCGRAYRKVFGAHTDAALAAMPRIGGLPADAVLAMAYADLTRFLETLTRPDDLRAVARLRGYGRDWLKRRLEAA